MAGYLAHQKMETWHTKRWTPETADGRAAGCDAQQPSSIKHQAQPVQQAHLYSSRSTSSSSFGSTFFPYVSMMLQQQFHTPAVPNRRLSHVSFDALCLLRHVVTLWQMNSQAAFTATCKIQYHAFQQCPALHSVQQFKGCD